MDFLKELFPENGGALTYEQLAALAQEKKLNIVNLAAGGYVSRHKHDDELNKLNGQITDLQSQITQRDTDLTDLRGKLTTAQADASKLGDVQTALTNLQTKYDGDKTAYEQRLAKQSYEFAIRERANGMKFSSEAAKRAFISEAIGKEFKQDGDNLLGYEDFVTKYKADDPGAFAIETPPADPPTPPAPSIVLPGSGSKPPRQRVSLTDMMIAKNNNPDMKVDYGM